MTRPRSSRSFAAPAPDAQIAAAPGRAPQRNSASGLGDRDLDPPFADPDRVVAEPPDPGQPTRFGFLAGDVRLRLFPAGRPNGMRSPIRVEAAGRRHLHDLAVAEVEPALVERTLDDAPIELAEAERSGHVGAAVVD